MKNRYFLSIAYHGSSFHGWQTQPNAISVQQTLNEHISLMLSEKINCVGCGRTDAGVHAKKYMLHFDSTKKLTAEFARKLDSFLPRDIRVFNIFDNPEKIHARWDALQRSYQYCITKGKDPFRFDLAAVSHEFLDINLMNDACKTLMKFNEFKTFSKTHNSHNHYLCDIKEAFWEETDSEYLFNITSNRFLRGMVRMIVGTMMEVGRGKMSVNDFNLVIEAQDRAKSGKSAPANGLYFIDVKFPEGRLIQL